MAGERKLAVRKKSAKLLHHTIKDSFLKVIENSGHGEISLIHTDSYIDLLQDFYEIAID